MSLRNRACMSANAQARRSAAWVPHGEETLFFRRHPSALSEAAPRLRCSLLSGGMPAANSCDRARNG
jgi:hypothetical protein